jgi:hypothetical protein
MASKAISLNKFAIGQHVMGFWTMPFAGHVVAFRWGMEKKKRYYQIPEALEDRDWMAEDLLVPYDQEKFERAWEKWLEVVRLRGEADTGVNEVIEMLRPGE